MELWVRRIALIAYVVGGWLLPAAHHHGNACEKSCPDTELHADCGQEVATAGIRVSECCSHSGDETNAATNPSKSSLAITADAPRISGNYAHAHGCGEHCVLCNARTMAESPLPNPVRSEAVCCVCDEQVDSTPIEDTADSWRPHKRGPPALA
ncbi:hypothetical protein LOC70_20830 [Rhodopirellula sp. JC737]|nr:hypothetical protein [Rhodopirellula sp. JC737]